MLIGGISGRQLKSYVLVWNFFRMAFCWYSLEIFVIYADAASLWGYIFNNTGIRSSLKFENP